MNNRKSRLPEIIDILNHNRVSSQEELARLLSKRGYTATQATLSRDLKILKATKQSDGRGNVRYVVEDVHALKHKGLRHHPTPTSLSAPSHASVLSIALSGSLAVIKTRNGYASGLAYDIDMLESDVILGTIPGADTVFVALSEDATHAELFRLFSSILPPAVMAVAMPYFKMGE